MGVACQETKVTTVREGQSLTQSERGRRAGAEGGGGAGSLPSGIFAR